MAYVLNDPADFVAELTKGFVLAHSDWVMEVPGGVIRAGDIPSGQVAVITGGGSGHYPAFAGLVGPGLTHGAAMGNIFASPSAQQVYNVAKAAHAGGGVLLTYGNYAGDVLNFKQAQERLRSEGIDCSTVVVTDDIASAPPEEAHKRRGIAGDLIVFKTAAAAAEAGKPLSEVAAVAQAANSATRSLGVAFTGCTLPGAQEPLFTVPSGRIAIGMGIHGEPGIEEQEIIPARDLAKLLVERILAEKPPLAGDRVVVLLNGLGATKSEELFVLYLSISELLVRAGVTIVEPEVGELVTSFEMAGLSLTLAWLTDELEQYWRAPANTPAYKKGVLELSASTRKVANVDAGDIAPPDASPTSQKAAVRASHLLDVIEAVIAKNSQYLGELDAVAGDGDHGIGMHRGSRAAAATGHIFVTKGAGIGTTLIAAGDAWADKAGGTSGALWGLLLRTVGQVLGDTAPVTPETASACIADAVSAVQSFGKAGIGDKTMVDSLVPFSATFASQIAAGVPMASSLDAAAREAKIAADATADLLPRVGRARAHNDKSLGTPDPGAVSFALIAQEIANKLMKG